MRDLYIFFSAVYLATMIFWLMYWGMRQPDDRDAPEWKQWNRILNITVILPFLLFVLITIWVMVAI